MLDPETLRQLRQLHALGWGAKRIASELGIARNTVRAYLRHEGRRSEPRPFVPRKMLADARSKAVALFDSQAQRNAVVVQALLAQQGSDVSVRTVQRAVQDHRAQQRAAQAATVRFETKPGDQMQIDFGEKWVVIAGQMVRVYRLVAVLSFSRRLFVKALLNQRQDDWREGLVGAFLRFGGVPRTLLCDNAWPLIKKRDSEQVWFQPAFDQFCKDWQVTPRACRPYRARTKGKVESGVKYVKSNGLAGREFDDFAALTRHLDGWMDEADRREHGTTHETPLARFEREEKLSLRLLPEHPLPVREQRLRRKVANDALVDVDTVRYSVPHALVRQNVEVLVLVDRVDIFHNRTLIASHERSREPHAIVRQASHYDGLWKSSTQGNQEVKNEVSELRKMGRSLQDYADVIGGDS
jgi:transposase